MSTASLVRPYPCLDSVLFRAIGAVLIDKAEPAPTVLEMDLTPEFGEPYCDMTRAEAWTLVDIPILVDFDLSQLPEELRDVGFISVLLCITCPITKLRRASLMSLTAEGAWLGMASFTRNEVLDRVTVSVRVTVGADDPIAKASGWFQGALIGESDTLNVYTDERAKPYTGQVKWHWEDFSESDKLDLSSRSDCLFFIDSSDVPTVFLNSGIDDLKGVLIGRDRKGPLTSTRFCIELSIAVPVYIQLLLTSLLHFAPDEETSEVAIDGSWRGGLVKSCIKSLYPGQCETAEEVLQTFHEQYREEASRALALAVVVARAQQLAKSDRRFRDAVKAADQFASEVDSNA